MFIGKKEDHQNVWMYSRYLCNYRPLSVLQFSSFRLGSTRHARVLWTLLTCTPWHRYCSSTREPRIDPHLCNSSGHQLTLRLLNPFTSSYVFLINKKENVTPSSQKHNQLTFKQKTIKLKCEKKKKNVYWDVSSFHLYFFI